MEARHNTRPCVQAFQVKRKVWQNSSGKVQKSSRAMREKSVLSMTHRLFIQQRHANVPAGGWMCTLGRQPQVMETACRSGWESSSRRGKFHPFIGVDVFLLQFWVKVAWKSCQSKISVFPHSAHFPEGVHPGRPRSRDKGQSFHNAPEENKIKPQESSFPEGPPDYN